MFIEFSTYLMEEINSIGRMDQQILNDNIINVRASDIIKIFASPENRHAFAIENSKSKLYNCRFIYT